MVRQKKICYTSEYVSITVVQSKSVWEILWLGTGMDLEGIPATVPLEFGKIVSALYIFHLILFYFVLNYIMLPLNSSRCYSMNFRPLDEVSGAVLGWEEFHDRLTDLTRAQINQSSLSF